MEETPEYPCSHCGYDPATDPSQAYVLRPGTILRGKYIIGAPLGQGGFGITYIGWDLSAERKVAIKEYFPSGQVSRNTTISNELLWYTTDQARSAQGGGMESFQKEARKMALVSNIPQVVNVLEVFQENATAYIVMDFVEGETLQKRLKKTGPLPWNQAKDIFLPVVNAMVQVHKAGLIHRDLSPDNLMLEPSGSVRILDLGAAKDLNINSGASSMQVAKGGFSPLEQYTQRGGSGTWTDVYALAATMYYSLTGVLPLPSMDRLVKDTLRWDLPQLTALPENVLTALQRAMVLQPDKRTQTMLEFSHQLTRTAPAQNREVPPEADANGEDGINDSYCQNDAAEQKLSSKQITNEKEAEPSCAPPCNSRENLTEPDSKAKAQEFPRSEQNMHTDPQNEKGQEERLKKQPLKYILIALAAAIAVIVCFFSIHIWDDATCTEPGKCRICGKLQGDALGHSWKAATCLTAKTCSVCGEISGSPLGHNWQEATCEKPKTCSRCGQTSGNVLGHTWQAATCEKAKTCSRCGQTSGSPLGHNWQAATCESPKTCETCGKTEGTASGHQWIAATYESPKRCKICGATQGNVKGYLPTASGHFSEEQVSHGNTSWNSFIFDSPLEGCTEFTFHMKLSDTEKGNPFGTWRIYTRNKWGGWVKIGSIKLESSSASARITLDTPTTISEIFVGAPYGWTPGFTASYSITDIYTRADS